MIYPNFAPDYQVFYMDISAASTLFYRLAFAVSKGKKAIKEDTKKQYAPQARTYIFAKMFQTTGRESGQNYP